MAPWPPASPDAWAPEREQRPKAHATCAESHPVAQGRLCSKAGTPQKAYASHLSAPLTLSRLSLTIKPTWVFCCLYCVLRGMEDHWSGGLAV